MNDNKRRTFDSAFNAKVALEAVKEIKTINELAAEYGIYPNQVIAWKKELLGNMDILFERKNAGKRNPEKEFEKERNRLHDKIGQLTIERDWLEKKSKQLGL